MGKAYWYKNGKLIEVGKIKYKTETTDGIEFGKTHIHDLVENPEIFGFTKEQIVSIYKKHGETVGNEGEAREEIMKKVIKNGWIRIRHNTGRNLDRWIIQFDNYPARKHDLQRMINKMLSEQILYNTDKVVLNGIDDEYVKVYDGYFDRKKGITSFLDESKKEDVQIVEDYKFFDY